MKQTQIANISLNFHSQDIHAPSEYYEGFEKYQGQLGRDETWNIFLSEEEAPDLNDYKIIFDSQGSWKAYKGKTEKEVFIQYSGKVDGVNTSVISTIKMNEEDYSIRFYPGLRKDWEFPIDELVFIKAFSNNSSMLVHSCLYEINGKGYLFGGVSGAGKSTLADIMSKSSLQGTVLCDERNALTLDKEGRCWASSTPWVGSSDACVPKTVPLEKILFLDPAHKGAMVEKIPMEVASLEFFLVTFFPLFSNNGMHATVELIATLLEKVPAYKLSYDKESSDVVELLQSKVFSQE